MKNYFRVTAHAPKIGKVEPPFVRVAMYIDDEPRGFIHLNVVQAEALRNSLQDRITEIHNYVAGKGKPNG